MEETQDVEENVWCTDYGLKGKLDVTVRYKHVDAVPLEVKSGGASISHRAQVIMYALMQQRHAGLLYYTRDNRMEEVKLVGGEVRAILQMRNRLAVSL